MKIQLGIKKKVDELSTRYYIPKKIEEVSTEFVKSDNAEDLANKLMIKGLKKVFVIVNGNFIFAEFISAFIVKANFHVKKMTISTLSMSYENVDTLADLINGDYVDKLDLIISGFHYSHKRNTIVRYTYEQLDFEDKFQMAVADCHTKICLFETHCGRFVTIKGSANLCSSGCIEEFSIESDKELYSFFDDYHTKVVEKYATIKKHIRGKELWRTINN